MLYTLKKPQWSGGDPYLRELYSKLLVFPASESASPVVFPSQQTELYASDLFRTLTDSSLSLAPCPVYHRVLWAPPLKDAQMPRPLPPPGLQRLWSGLPTAPLLPPLPPCNQSSTQQPEWACGEVSQFTAPQRLSSSFQVPTKVPTAAFQVPSPSGFRHFPDSSLLVLSIRPHCPLRRNSNWPAAVPPGPLHRPFALPGLTFSQIST